MKHVLCNIENKNISTITIINALEFIYFIFKNLNKKNISNGKN